MTIFSIVHEGDSMDEFFWNAWGVPQPPDDGNSYESVRLNIDLGSGNKVIAAAKARPGSRIQTNAGDLDDRVAALNAIIASDYPATVGARSAVHADTRQDRHWILSLQIGTNPDNSSPSTQLGFLEAYLATLNPLWNVIVSTLPSRTDLVLGGTSLTFDTIYRIPYNLLVNDPDWAPAHGVTAADIASAAVLGALGAAENTTYFADKVHVTAAGAAAGGPILRAAIDGVIASLL